MRCRFTADVRSAGVYVVMGPGVSRWARLLRQHTEAVDTWARRLWRPLARSSGKTASQTAHRRVMGQAYAGHRTDERVPLLHAYEASSAAMRTSTTPRARNGAFGPEPMAAVRGDGQRGALVQRTAKRDDPVAESLKPRACADRDKARTCSAPLMTTSDCGDCDCDG